MKTISDFRNKKVLVMGLGSLGGGIATTKWLLKHGAKVLVTDLRSKEKLKSSIKKLENAAGKVKFVLGEHREGDFKNNDTIVVNPAVPRESKYLAVARKSGKELVNDARIFFNKVKNPVVAVTGTRGKTTVANWLAHFLKSKYPQAVAAGNSSDMALLALTDKLKGKKNPAVIELSSWQLELLPGARRAPDVAVITNIYPDHLNRYDSVRDYALAKANIFKGQRKSQGLILNADNVWTKFFLEQKPRSEAFLFSKKPLGGKQNGIFLKDGAVYFRSGGTAEKVISERIIRGFLFRGEHNLENLLASLLASHLLGIDWVALARRIGTLPDIPYREQVIMKRKNLTVVNDSAATSPDAVIAAVKRFAPRGNVILVTGGTDKNLDFRELAKTLKKYLKPSQTYFLNGSATQKLVAALKRIGYFGSRNPQIHENLMDIMTGIRNKELGIATQRRGRSVIPNSKFIILFSPGAASFEKFKNEFDRGERFTKYAKRIFS